MKMHQTPLRLSIAVFIVIVSAVLASESGVTLIDGIGKPEGYSRFNPLFPRALTWKGALEIAEGVPGGLVTVPTYAESLRQSRENPRLQSVLLNNDIVSLYGKPGAVNMGLLGQYPLKALDGVMEQFVVPYEAANGDRGIIPSLYIIYGTCWPGGDIGILQDTVTRSYIEYAQERGWYVFLDHQIGRFTVEAAVNRLLPWLKYPNVHLALDPEWRTTRPMQEIGSVTAAELNMAQGMIQDYLMEQNLPGRRMLVVHQFKPVMILNRAEVRTNFELVQFIHCADGFGSPSLKQKAYKYNAEAANIPLKSFKLFLKPTIEGAGWDQPLMTPEQVFALDPRPYLIMYQ